MGKGIYTVAFPDLNDIDDKDVKLCKLKVQKHVSRLHQLIEESSDTVDVLHNVDRDISNARCSVMYSTIM